MSSFYGLQGKLTAHEGELDDTSEKVVVAAKDERNQSRVIESIYLSASGAETITIAVKEGATVRFLYAQDQPLDADTPIHIINHPRVLKPGEQITVTAGTGALAWVSIITVDLTIQQGSPAK
jgi:hypothetical protein